MADTKALNALPDDDARTALLRCCGSKQWVEKMLAARPFDGEEALFGASDTIWWGLDRDAWLEAFAAHPRIGSKKDVEKKPEKAWSSNEQAGAASAAQATLDALAQANADYEQKFGHIYIVCATGKSADEMLGIARARLSNDAETELRIAAEEQRKITHIRLAKLLAELTSGKDAHEPAQTETKGTHVHASITTHVLDTAQGRPARGVGIVLLEQVGDAEFREIGRGKTDDDGRLKTLLGGEPLQVGTYRLLFDVAGYLGRDSFFPEVTITFVVRDAAQHHHVPLLLSPYGYSTYRGS